MAKILFFDHTAKLSGAEIALMELVRCSAHRVTVLVAEDGPLVSELEARGAEVLVLAASKNLTSSRHQRGTALAIIRALTGLLRYNIQLRRLVVQMDLDLIVINTSRGLVLAMSLYRIGVPVLSIIRDQLTRAQFTRMRLLLLRLIILLGVDAVVANSLSTLSTVPRGLRHRVRLALPSPVLPPPSALVECSSRPVENEILRFVIVGRLAPWKGQDLAIRAFAVAFSNGREVLDVIGGPLFGEEPYEANLKKLAEDLGVGHRVIFRGQVRDPYTYMAKAQVLLHCSLVPEPFGQVVVQGLALGLVVLAADSGGPRETIVSGQNGVLYPMGSLDGLAKAMRDCARDPEEFDFRHAGIHAAKSYHPEVVSGKFDALFDHVIAKRK